MKEKEYIPFDDLIWPEVKIARVSSVKPKMLLHVCCAICASHVLDLLKDEFDITVFFYNPNIHPKEEYNLRLSEVRRLIKEMNLDIDVIDGVYNTQDFFDKTSMYKKEREGGLRCTECFKIRLGATAEFAKKNGYDCFTTTLSISPHKNSNILNEVGTDLGIEHRVKYVQANLKEKVGYKKANEISKRYDIYRQQYCGCVYSMLNNEGEDENENR